MIRKIQNPCRPHDEEQHNEHWEQIWGTTTTPKQNLSLNNEEPGSRAC